MAFPAKGWFLLDNVRRFDDLLEASTSFPVVIFKHSTRCGLSALKLDEIKTWHDSRPELPVYFLDVIRHRNISDLIEDQFAVRHETPQVLLISNKACIYDEDHMRISGLNMDEILEKRTAHEDSNHR